MSDKNFEAVKTGPSTFKMDNARTLAVSSVAMAVQLNAEVFSQ